MIFFLAAMYRCESWTIKKADHQRIDAFNLWCWRRLLRVFWTARRSNQSIIKEINPEYSLEGLMLKLTLQCFGHTWCEEPTHWKRPWCWERWRHQEKGHQRMRWLDSITDSTDMNLSKLWEIVEDRGTWLAIVHRVTKSWRQLSGWKTTTKLKINLGAKTVVYENKHKVRTPEHNHN